MARAVDRGRVRSLARSGPTSSASPIARRTARGHCCLSWPTCDTGTNCPASLGSPASAGTHQRCNFACGLVRAARCMRAFLEGVLQSVQDAVGWTACVDFKAMPSNPMRVSDCLDAGLRAPQGITGRQQVVCLYSARGCRLASITCAQPVLHTATWFRLAEQKRFCIWPRIACVSGSLLAHHALAASAGWVCLGG